MVIVGAGEAAPARLALREGGYDGPVTLIGAEPHFPFERPPLSKDAMLAEALVPKAIGGADRLAGLGVDFRPEISATATGTGCSATTAARLATSGCSLPSARVRAPCRSPAQTVPTP